MKTRLTQSFLPLSPAALHILLALVDEDRHGYAIMQEIRAHSNGEYNIGPGTLYDRLQKMMQEELVEESHKPGEDEDPRRRYYHLTRIGRNVLTAELNRLNNIVQDAKVRLKLAIERRR